MMAACWSLIVSLMLLADNPNFTGLTTSHDRRPVASAVRVDPATNKNLLKAAREGDLATVENLIGQEVNYNLGRVLSTAGRYGQVEIVKALLQAGANPDGTFHSSSYPSPGWPLYWASGDNHIDIIDLLLEAGADVNAHPIVGGIALKAAKNGHLEAVNRLLAAGFDPDTDEGFALAEAAKNGHGDVVDAFIDAGANVTVGFGHVVVRAASYGYQDIVDALLEAGINTDDYGPALSVAAKEGHLDIVKLMLEKGTDPSYGHTLKSAADAGHLEEVKTLLEAGCTFTYSINSTQTESPLHYAAIGGHVDVIELLVQYGADVNAPFAEDLWWDADEDLRHHGRGWTVVHLASRWGHQPILQKLVDLGADVNAVDDKGNSPLHVAVIKMKLKVVDELLRLCADSHLPNKNGETALDVAQRTVSQVLSDHPQPTWMLKDLATDLLKEKISYYPYTENFMKELAREVQATIDSNKTLSELLEEQTPDASWSNIQLATRTVFEDEAISGLLKVFRDHRCKLRMEDNFQAELGFQFLVRCDCLLGQGRKLTIKHIPQEDMCATAETDQD